MRVTTRTCVYIYIVGVGVCVCVWRGGGGCSPLGYALAHKQEAIRMVKLAMWYLQIDCKRRPKMYEVVKVLEGTMSQTEIDHNFVVTIQQASVLLELWICQLHL